MTPLKKSVTRRSDEIYRDRSKFRRIVVTLHPAGYMGSPDELSKIVR